MAVDISSEHSSSKVDEDDNILSDLDFIRFLIVAQKNIHWMLLIFLLCGIFSFLYLRYTKTVFQSRSIIKYDIKQMSPVFNQQQADNISYLSGEIELIKSNLIYDKVVDILPLQVSYFAYGRINNTERYKDSPFLVKYFLFREDFYNRIFDVRIVDENSFELSYKVGNNDVTDKYTFGEIIDKPEFKIIIGKNDNISNLEIGQKYYFVINSREQLQQYLASGLTVKVANAEAKTIEISFSDFDNEKARDIVVVIDSVYMSETILKKNKAHEQSIAFLNEQLRMTEQNLDQYERKIESFTRVNRTPDIKGEISRYLTKSEIEATQLDKLKIQFNIISKLQDAIYKETGIEKVMPLLYLLENDAELQAEATKLMELQLKQHHVLETSKSTTFTSKSIKTEIAQSRDILIDHISEYKKLLSDEIDRTKERVKEYETAFTILPSKETEFTKLKRFYDLYEKFYLMLIDKKAEYGISKAGTVPEFQILASAAISKQPVYPVPFQVYFIGAMSGLVLSFLLIISQYFLHNTINNVGELERLCLAPMIGFIPNFNSQKMDYSKLVVNEFPKSPVSEALRSIRTNMEFTSKGKNNKVISITSTISGEGKTFVAINLGGIIAMSGQKVVILDLDLRKPKISKAFGADNQKGISTILIGRSALEDSINDTQIPGYSFISSGPVPPNPSELIMSKEFDVLLEQLKLKFDVIIIDTPPVGIVTDAILAMKKSDLTIYVVRAEYSKKGFERSINNLITKNKFQNLVVMLNGFDNLKSYAYGYKYGYGQGYGYGDYYNMDEGKSPKGLLRKIKGFINIV
ncbi:MAG: polysaccharide biosynthesis tyrosine autokinase [Opitutaceae bacterium]|nr:polysaccharide biosynthesis tyrosine autokinase [Cytophagales bacterium]